MIPSVTPVLPSTGTPPTPSPPAASGAPDAPAPTAAPLLQSSLEPVHNVVGFVFKLADTQTGRVVVELPFQPDPNAVDADAQAHVDLKV